MNHPSEKRKLKTFLYWTVSPIFSGILPAATIFWGYYHSKEEIWLSLLLAIPLIAHCIICIYSLIKRNRLEDLSFMAVFCVLNFISLYPYLLAWLIFIHNARMEIDAWGSTVDAWAAGACLVIIGVLVATMILFSYLFLHPDGSLLRNYRIGLKQMHFAALMHFFSIFLCIGFLAGFALALHDRSTNYNDLYMENLKSKMPPEESVNAPSRLGTCFYFGLPKDEFSGANLAMSEREPSSTSFGTAESVQEKLENENFNRLNAVVLYIIKINQDDNNKTALVRLVGKADSKPLQNGIFPNNLALSNARIEKVHSAVVEELSKRKYPILNLKWDSVPVSSDKEATLFRLPSFPLGRETYCGPIGTDKTTNERVVEVAIEATVSVAPPDRGQLMLMDYVYFSIYTITTTGYGDIKPVSAYSKWVCSLENIIEVFFLVIFVNLVIAYSNSPASSNTALVRPK